MLADLAAPNPILEVVDWPSRRSPMSEAEIRLEVLRLVTAASSGSIVMPEAILRQAEAYAAFIFGYPSAEHGSSQASERPGDIQQTKQASDPSSLAARSECSR